MRALQVLSKVDIVGREQVDKCVRLPLLSLQHAPTHVCTREHTELRPRADSWSSAIQTCCPCWAPRWRPSSQRSMLPSLAWYAWPPVRSAMRGADGARWQLDDYSMVGFVPLDVRDEERINDLLLQVDMAMQYGEDLEPGDMRDEEADGEEEGHDA